MIATSRLLLRPFTPADEAEFLPCLMSAEFMVFSPSGALNPNQAAQRFAELVQGATSEGFGKLAVVEKAGGRIIGYCGVEPYTLAGEAVGELGFRLMPIWRGHGYATEAARAVLTHLQQLGSPVPIAFTEPGNQASINVLTKLGFTATGIDTFQGMDIVLFSLTSGNCQ